MPLPVAEFQYVEIPVPGLPYWLYCAVIASTVGTAVIVWIVLRRERRKR